MIIKAQTKYFTIIDNEFTTDWHNKFVVLSTNRTMMVKLMNAVGFRNVKEQLKYSDSLLRFRFYTGSIKKILSYIRCIENDSRSSKEVRNLIPWSQTDKQD